MAVEPALTSHRISFRCPQLLASGKCGPEWTWDSQILPSIRTHSRAVHIMRVPAPNRVQTFGLQIESSFQRGRIVQTEVGAKPIYHSGFGGRHESRISVGKSTQRERICFPVWTDGERHRMSLLFATALGRAPKFCDHVWVPCLNYLLTRRARKSCRHHAAGVSLANLPRSRLKRQAQKN